MKFTLTSERMRAMYDFLSTCPPFDGWNLPAGEDVTFRRTRMKDTRGWYNQVKGAHIIALSPRQITTLELMMRTIAHEMIHLHEKETEMATRAHHTEAFMILSRRVCEVFGWLEITDKTDML